MFFRFLLSILIAFSFIIPGKFALLHLQYILSPGYFELVSFLILFISLFYFNIFFQYVRTALFFQLGLFKDYNDWKSSEKKSLKTIMKNVSLGVTFIIGLSSLLIGFVLFKNIFDKYNLGENVILLLITLFGVISLSLLIFNNLANFIAKLAKS